MDLKHIYLDNNATTFMTPAIIQTMVKWCNKGNPSADYDSAKEVQSMMAEFRKYIGEISGFDPYNKDGYAVIFTSGASEANSTIIQSIIRTYSAAIGKPHVIVSSIEHKSILNLVQSLEIGGELEATYIKATLTGHIMLEDIRAAIRPNTCVISIMHANNETGAINDINSIGKLAHEHSIPFHCDAVQTFGKFPINPNKCNVDSFCVSFHKFHGPPGVGILVIKRKLLVGYKLTPLIYGTQNESMRGGTENVPGIAASFAATKYTMRSRDAKNKSMEEVKKYIMAEISKRIPCSYYVNYYKSPSKHEKEIVFLSNIQGYLPNTILLSVIKRSKPPACNVQIKKLLEAQGIIVSVGSACNTSSSKASHVLYAMKADELIRKGALRISIGDATTLDEAKKFIKAFLIIVSKL